MLPRVLVVLTSSSRRGAEVQGVALTNALRGAGVDASVVALAVGSGQARLGVPALGRSPLSLPTLRRLRALAGTCDVVIGYGSKTLPACVLALPGVSAQFVYRGIGDPAAWAGGPIKQRRTRMLYRRVDHVAALWPGAAEAIHDLYGIDQRRITAIPNARSTDEFRPATEGTRREARHALGLPLDAELVGWIGTVAPEKRFELAVEAIGSDPGIHLVVAGAGYGRGAANAAEQLAPGRVHHLGELTDVGPLYAAVDAVLSTSSTEGMPGVIIEAALSGRPAIATDVGASREVVGPGGRVVPPDSGPETLHLALRSVLADRESLGRTALQHATERFSWQSVLPRWLTLLEAVSASELTP